MTLATSAQNADPLPLHCIPQPAELARTVVESEVLVEAAQHHAKMMLLLAFQPMEVTPGDGDVEDLGAILDEVCARFPFNPRRIHVAGLSSGAGMAVAALVCDGERVASRVAVAGVPYLDSPSVAGARDEGGHLCIWCRPWTTRWERASGHCPCSSCTRTTTRWSASGRPGACATPGPRASTSTCSTMCASRPGCTARSNGSAPAVQLRLTPVELIERLAALIPPPQSTQHPALSSAGTCDTVQFPHERMVFTVEQMKESLGALAIALGLSLIASEAPAQSAPDWGKAEYESNCASCHGLGGKGDGPLSESFRTKAADLTTLAKRNDGVFPAQRVYEIIDGRQEVAAHGPRAMPVWGRDYRSQVPDVTLGDTQIYGLKDAVTHNKLIALVDYLHRLQVK